jgi:hypothetical protein
MTMDVQLKIVCDGFLYTIFHQIFLNPLIQSYPKNVCIIS